MPQSLLDVLFSSLLAPYARLTTVSAFSDEYFCQLPFIYKLFTGVQTALRDFWV